MSTTEPDVAEGITERRERKFVLLLCLLGAVHVFVFSAAFPFFNVMDEQMHFDLVLRYSRGQIPRSLGPASTEAIPYIVIFGTPEYFWSPETQPGQRIPAPPWTRPTEGLSQTLLAKQAFWKETVRNHESSQPPLYYALGGLWWQFGKTCGLEGGRLLYWLRFLNIPLVMALVWLSYLVARSFFPGNLVIKLGVPALIAFLPQTVLYSIQNDVVSPLTFGLAFVLLVNFWDSERPQVSVAAGAGLALAATFLTKISNLPLIAASGGFVALKIARLLRNGRLRPWFPALAVLAACAGLPMVAWAAWCKTHFGDFTGSALKVQLLGWTDKPLAEWWRHPIFTLRGGWTFLSGNLATLWQGELLWQRRPLAIPGVDLAYVVVSLGLLARTLVALLRRMPIAHQGSRAALWFGLVCVAMEFAFFALLSVKYDFHDCFYPSREHPYFTSGRLMLGALIPFLLLFTSGLDCSLAQLGQRTKCLVLGGLILCMVAAEAAIDWPVFPNAYNWYHM